MSGLSIGIGVGLRYNRQPLSGNVGGYTPEPDITDALLTGDGVLLMMEDGSYFRLNEGEIVTRKIDKSYWKF